MNYYYRRITRRASSYINGNIIYIPIIQVVKTDNIEAYNHRKRIRFSPMPLTMERYDILPDKIYEYEAEW